MTMARRLLCLHASKNGHLEVVRLLLECRADKDFAGNDGGSSEGNLRGCTFGSAVGFSLTAIPQLPLVVQTNTGLFKESFPRFGSSKRLACRMISYGPSAMKPKQEIDLPP